MKGTNIDGDVAIGRNLALGGNVVAQGMAHIKGGLRVDGWLDAENIKAANKGLFQNESELKKEYPKPLAGWFAVVIDDIDKATGFIYTTVDGTWKKTQEQAMPYEFIMDSVNVFATKNEFEQEKERIQEIDDELLKRIQGVSDNSNSAKDPFKFLGTFTRVTGGDFLNALNAMHGTASGVYDGYWRALIGASPVEIYNFAIYYKDDRWIQVLKSPYKWGDGDFDIIHDTRYRTIYRIHENGAWGEWRDTEKELEKFISDETTRARTAEQAIATAIANEVTRAKRAEEDLSERIDNIPTGGGGTGGTGDIADGAVTESKLSTVVKKKLNTAYDKANLADSLFVNDGIEIYKGVLVEKSDPYTGTSYEMYSSKILANGEKVVLAEGFKFTSYKIFKGDAEIFYSAFDGNELTLEDKGYIYQLGIARSDNDSVTSTDFRKVIKSFIRNPYAWDSNSNLNNFTLQGRYTIRGEREANANDNMPIYNGGKVEARLEVLENENTLVQRLLLLNVGGGDGNIYTRTRQNGSWGAWGKLQTNIEVGRVEGSNAFDNFTDNGMYSGVYAYGSTAETFVLVVINAYLYGGGVAQLKYSTLLDGTTTVKIRTRVNNSWGEWQGLGGDYTLPIATADVLGGIKSNSTYGYVGDNPFGNEHAVNVGSDGRATVTIPVADNKNNGVVKVDSSVNSESDNPVSSKAVAEFVEDAVEQPIVQQTETTVEIAPNVLNVWGEVAELDITLAPGKEGVCNEYMIEFVSGEKATTLILPADIKWAALPQIQQNKAYQISIINNFGVIGEF